LLNNTKQVSTTGVAVVAPPEKKLIPAPVNIPSEIIQPAENENKNQESRGQAPLVAEKTQVSKAVKKQDAINKPGVIKNEPVVEYSVIPNEQVVETTAPTEIASNANPAINTKELNNPIIKTIQNTGNAPLVAQLAVYNEDAVDEEPEYVNIAGARIKKQKLRGIFRNVTRTVGRTFEKSNVAEADVASLK